MNETPFEPTDSAEVAALLALAKVEQRTLVPRGSGTKIGWNGTTPVQAFLSTLRLVSRVEHYAGDLVATISAGTTLAEANAVLGGARQWLPLDPTHAERATIGGIVATNDSGPRRHQHGSPRDLIIGVEVALTDGRVVKAGGRVVKNVAGYDLSRLLCGSYGSLGVITSATFKLAPIAPSSRTVVAQMGDVSRAVATAHVLAASPLTPSAIEIQAPSARVLVRFETTERAADHMAAQARILLERGGATTDTVTGDEERDEWAKHAELVWAQDGCLVKVSVLPTEMASVFESLSCAAGSAGTQHGAGWACVGRAALGVLLIRLRGNVEQQVAAVNGLRRAIPAHSGHVTVLEGPDEARARPAGRKDRGSLDALLGSVKQRFDPSGVLRPEPRP